MARRIQKYKKPLSPIIPVNIPEPTFEAWELVGKIIYWPFKIMFYLVGMVFVGIFSFIFSTLKR